MSSTIKEKLDKYMKKVKEGLPKKAKNVLPKITDYHRNLLAVRGYLKYGDRMERWPFLTSKEEQDFKKTETYRKLENERKEIIKKFGEKNKGYALKGSNKGRTLEKQIANWNRNDNVLALGRNLETQALNEIKKRPYPDEPTDEAVKSFKKWLKRVYLTAKVGKSTYHSPTHATPGLSSHGRIQAIDFLIYKGKRLIAGASTKTAKTAWDKPGWTKKLNDAVTSVSKNWDGPLRNPYEPWHYTYIGT